jgi:hypothetical protein
VNGSGVEEKAVYLVTVGNLSVTDSQSLSSSALRLEVYARKSMLDRKYRGLTLGNASPR